MVNIFLTDKQRGNIQNWTYSVDDNSITTKIFTPFWNYIVKLVPDTVAANILTLVGLFCNIYAYYITEQYISNYPRTISLLACLLNFIYMHLDAIDGKHARKIRNASPLGELFDHSCDNIGVIFMVLTLCNILGISEATTQWYLVQIAQLIFLHSHIDAFKNRTVKFGLLTGPGEVLMLYFGIILCKSLNFVGYTILLDWFTYSAEIFGLDSVQLGEYTVVALYYIVLGTVLLNVYNLKDHYETRNGLFISLGIRFIPSVLIYLNLISDTLSVYTIISHGLIMAVLTGDMIVSKMAQRELHPLVPTFTIISLFNNFFCVSTCVFYYISVLTEIAHYLRIPLMNVQKRIYCNGVYDLTHQGHMNIFERAASLGTHVIVGIHNDATVESYKRKTILSEKIRYETVAKCKYVDEIVLGAPLVITEKFIRDNNIHIVICSPEYEHEEDIYYAAPRKMGILHVLPRTEGVSTSKIIKEIRSRKIMINKQTNKVDELTLEHPSFENGTKYLEDTQILQSILFNNKKSKQIENIETNEN